MPLPSREQAVEILHEHLNGAYVLRHHLQGAVLDLLARKTVYQDLWWDAAGDEPAQFLIHLQYFVDSHAPAVAGLRAGLAALSLERANPLRARGWVRDPGV